ncbi:hypothetical protein MKW92_009339 [Papaver armeniacum]|nr:hypothetical protein MKW92_009339 [Papaver armeniacum]
MVNPQSGDLGVSHSHRSLHELSWAELLPWSLEDDGLNCEGSQDVLERFHYVVGDDTAKEILRRCPEFRIRLQKIGCNWNLIHLASEYGYVELVKALVTKDASICSSLDLSNKSPLDYAAMSWRTQVIHELLSPKVCIQLSVGEVKLLLQNALCIALGKRQREAFRVLAMKYMEDWVHQYDRIKAAKVHPSNCVYDQKV